MTHLGKVGSTELNVNLVEKELQTITVALRSPQSDADYCNLYSAQQALSWALDPDSYAAPSVTIANGKVQPLIKDTQANSEDCPGESRRFAS